MRSPVAVGSSLCVALALLTGACTAGENPAATAAAAVTAAPPSAAVDAPSRDGEATKPSSGATASAEPTEDDSQAIALARVPGNESGLCVKVDGHRDVRSGSIMGGAFDSALRAWGTERPGSDPYVLNLYWVPLHVNSDTELSVTAARSGSDAKATASSDSAEQAEQWRYYATGLELKEAGTWRLDVAVGLDKGCFELTLKEADS